jgi:nitroimidazol reductase NimA-like FMN-containing flavoprotein (pyridoxamine 5'-phosphate oxidase superfamily)
MGTPYSPITRKKKEDKAMHDINRLKKRLEELLQSQKLSVLATHTQGQPYGSLVSFAATKDLKQILFATTRSTRKYANLKKDTRVALVVDSRENTERDLHKAMAVTVTGKAEETGPSEEEAYLKIYLEKHPYLKDFVKSPTCALLRVKVDTYYLVRRFQEVTELHVGDWT